MSFFSKIFNRNSNLKDPDIQFGRYTDSYKADEKYQNWDKAIECFENEKYIQSYKEFLQFITHDEQKNVAYQLLPGKITFKIFQGSKIITGEANFTHFKAEARIVRYDVPNVELMKLLLEENYNLKYTKYALNSDNTICLVFDTLVEDGSPHKIYQALKELATEADRKDDILMARFDNVFPVDYDHIRKIDVEEKNLKFTHFKKWITSVVHEAESGRLDKKLYPGGLSYYLLNLLYKIDYLIKPEGTIMECIKDCHDLYFKGNIINVHDKNDIIISKIKDLSTMTFDSFVKELYEVNSTFGTAMPEGHQRLAEIIEAQMDDLDWYAENGYEVYAQAICGYLAGFSLYSYSLPAPSKALLTLYYRIVESDFFRALGYQQQFLNNGEPDKKEILKAVKKVVITNQVDFPNLTIPFKLLDFSGSSNFYKSFFIMIQKTSYHV